MNERLKKQNLARLPHILVVDDDDRIRMLVARYLSDHDFFVTTAADSAEAKAVLSFAEYDALVVDVMMPGQSGMEFTQELRQSGKMQKDIPVLLLTAMGETENKIEGLTSGADDYLTKPFDPRELVLRLQAILRRRPQKDQEQAKLKIGRWTFDFDHNELLDEASDHSVKLTDGEANLLKALSVHTGQVMSREDLSEACGLASDKRTVDVQVTRLRRKVEEDSNNPRYIQTVRGKGYILRAEKI
ncbi:MAG: response regulator transcription factor [Alphaproteobacteria bacterium]|nr:response regulator transcription factor [Alphaproteobacteria bacterium]